MMPKSELYYLCKKVEKEVDENRELMCSLMEVITLFMPIIPSSLWNRLLMVCFYVVLYNVGGHDRYFEMKKKYLASPKKCIDIDYSDSSESDDAYIDARNKKDDDYDDNDDDDDDDDDDDNEDDDDDDNEDDDDDNDDDDNDDDDNEDDSDYEESKKNQ